MNKFLAIGFVLVSTSAMAQDAKPAQVNRFTACVQQWRDMKAAPDFKPVKFQYREHMSACLKKSTGPKTRGAAIEATE